MIKAILFLLKNIKSLSKLTKIIAKNVFFLFSPFKYFKLIHCFIILIFLFDAEAVLLLLKG